MRSKPKKHAKSTVWKHEETGETNDIEVAQGEEAKSRWDEPPRKAYRVGRLPSTLEQTEVRETALRELQEDMWAPSSRRAMEAKLATVEKMLRYWGTCASLFDTRESTGFGRLPEAGELQIGRLILGNLPRVRRERWPGTLIQ